MKLIAVISHKGGAGKTTTAVQLAEELARRGQRTLLVDADRQQGAGLLLGIDSPAGCVQQTSVPQLDYLGSARLTDLEVADCYASIADRFDLGIVDTPSLDDALARAWLREAAAALMVLQVDPLTVKTLPSALNTLEVVRAFKPSIVLLGLLPTMFNQEEAAHRSLLAELLSRRPEAVFTPVVPADSGLMHRANVQEHPPVGEAARQAYQCAVDRILRALGNEETPSVGLLRPATGTAAPGASPQRAVPPWQQVPATPIPGRAELLEPASTPASQRHRAQRGAGGAPDAGPGQVERGVPHAGAPAPAGTGPQVAGSQSSGGWLAGQAQSVSGPPLRGAAPPEASSGQQPGAPPHDAGLPRASHEVPPAGGPVFAASRPAEPEPEPLPALETLTAPAPGAAPRPERSGPDSDPDWWRKESARVDPQGVARRPEPWLVRARFAIACTVACLALIAAIVIGTMKRSPAVANGGPVAGPEIPAAFAAANGKQGQEGSKGQSAGKAEKKARHAAKRE